MRRYSSIILMVALALITACSPFLTNPTSTPVTANTLFPAVPSTVTPIPTLTASPMIEASMTPSVASSLTSTATIPTLTLPPMTTSAWQPVIGLSVGETFAFASCTGTTPVQFNGTITTNDSATVEYDWLLRWGTKGTYNTPTQKVNFTSGGTKTVKSGSTYNAQCGRYSVSLHIINPNYMIATKYFSIPK